MKLKNLLPLLLIFALSFSSCTSKKEQSPDYIGEQLFEMLQNFDDITAEEYANYILPYEAFIKIINDNDDQADDEFQEYIEGFTEEVYEQAQFQQYNFLKEQAEFSEIVWKDIKFEDFTYEISNEQDRDFLEGLMTFSHHGETYQTEVNAVWYGEKYEISIVPELYQGATALMEEAEIENGVEGEIEEKVDEE